MIQAVWNLPRNWAATTHSREAAVHEGLPDQLSAVQLRGTVRAPEALSTDAHAQTLGDRRRRLGGSPEHHPCPT